MRQAEEPAAALVANARPRAVDCQQPSLGMLQREHRHMALRAQRAHHVVRQDTACRWQRSRRMLSQATSARGSRLSCSPQQVPPDCLPWPSKSRRPQQHSNMNCTPSRWWGRCEQAQTICVNRGAVGPPQLQVCSAAHLPGSGASPGTAQACRRPAPAGLPHRPAAATALAARCQGAIPPATPGSSRDKWNRCPSSCRGSRHSLPARATCAPFPLRPSLQECRAARPAGPSA